MEKVNKVFSDEKKILTRIGNYTPTGKTLGKGHFARVVEAYHTLLKVKVAIKIINKIEISDTYVKKNLKRETKIMSKISHPNIIYIFETIETTQHYYIITELGSGGDLCNFVKSQRYGKLDEKRARPLATQLVSAVGHLHERGIVHRDLKMENILLDKAKEKIKLVDFGLSNFCQLNELLKTHCGSPEYAAPELYIKGRKYGPEVDIWSLGIIFYGMLVGTLPFQTTHLNEINHNDRKKFLMQETRKGLTMKHQTNMLDLSYLIRNLIMKMLKPDANERISMHQLQLHAWVYGSNKIREFPAEDRHWHKKVIEKISSYYGLKCPETYNRILNLPYGPFGGMYNVEKFIHLHEKLNEYYFKYETIKLKNSSPLTSSPTSTASNLHPSKSSQINFKTKERKSLPKSIKYLKSSTIDLQENIFDDKKISNNLSDKIKIEYNNNSPTKPKYIKNNNNNLQQQQKSPISSNASSKKPTKSSSIKMINYLNAKISRALGMYSLQRNLKFKTGIETKVRKIPKIAKLPTTKHLPNTLNNTFKNLNDQEILKDINPYHNNNIDKNYKIINYQNNINQKYIIRKNLTNQEQQSHHNNLPTYHYNQKLNLSHKNILDKTKIYNQKYLIKSKLYDSNINNNNIKSKLFCYNNRNINNYNKTSSILPFTSILQSKNKLNQLTNGFNIINSDYNCRKGAIKKKVITE